MAKRVIRDIYTLWEYVKAVESIQDGVTLPPRWWHYRRWLGRMPISKLKACVNRGDTLYYVKRFGYVRNGDVYEVDQKCVGAICMVVILANGGLSVSTIAKTTGLSVNCVKSIFKNYKYYVGWHNAYLPDGRRIWPVIKEVELLHKDTYGEV